jgi:sortase (surface protein transpeptidase)
MITRHRKAHRRPRFAPPPLLTLLLLLLLLLLLAGCQPVQNPLTPTPTPFPTAIRSTFGTPDATPTLTPDAALEGSPDVAAGTPVPAETSAPETLSAPEALLTPETLPASQAAGAAPTPTPVPAPVRLTIPAIDFDVPVQAMGWEIIRRNNRRTTEWVLPEDAAGWHVNSARAGEPGNTIISGHQIEGAAVFAPLALGEVRLGQEIELTDSSGRTFVYRVTEVSDPLPIRGGGSEVEEALARYTAPSTTGRLTLITGWPDFTTTHRLFVVAELVGEADSSGG